MSLNQEDMLISYTSDLEQPKKKIDADMYVFDLQNRHWERCSGYRANLFLILSIMISVRRNAQTMTKYVVVAVSRFRRQA